MKFKVGDKVKCIDASESMLGELKEGENYIILDVDKEGFVKLKGLSDYDYDPSRFKKEYTYENLKKAPIGTKITFENGEVLIKDRPNFYESPNTYRYNGDLENLKDNNGTYGKIIKIEEPEYTTVYEHKPEILDEAEKRYLRGVIGPYKNDVTTIRKEAVNRNNKNCYFLCIEYKNDTCTCLHSFSPNTMYKGMKLFKEYTLEELGL